MHEGRVIPLGAAAIAAAVLVIWWYQTPVSPLVPRVSAEDKARLDARLTSPRIPLQLGEVVQPASGTHAKQAGKASDLPGAWPQFRGPARDGICRDGAGLKTSWATPPRVLWSREVGEGHAGPAVLGGKVFLADYDTEAQADVIRCMSLADGKDIWTYSYPVQVKRNHGMSRTVPAVTDKYLVALGPMGHVICLNSGDGTGRWQTDLVKTLGTRIPQWYAGQCPLIDAGRAILAPCGSALMLAVDCETGKVVWQTPNEKNWQMTHSSIAVAEFAGRRMYVLPVNTAVVGVDAQTGTRLWHVDWKVRMANVPAPVPAGQGRILVTGGYDAGAMMIQLSSDGEGIRARSVWRKTAREFGATQHTPILYNGCFYAVRQGKQLACMDTKGNVLWASGAGAKFGLGPFLLAEPARPGEKALLFLLDDNGLLTLAEATPAGYKPLGQTQAVVHVDEHGKKHPGHDAWAPMALVHGRLLLRDLTKMVCLDVRK